MDLRVDDDAMRSLVAKSIVDSLNQETRENLIKEAVRHVLATPEQGSYFGSKRSPLQQAFDRAVEQEAMRYAKEVLESDTSFKQQIQTLFADVAKRMFESEGRDKMIHDIASTITRALTKDRY